MTQLCVSSECNLPGTHREPCDDEQCRGCGPAVARDGLYLCQLCVRRLPHDAYRAARVYVALGLALTGPTGGGGSGGGAHDDDGLELDRAAVELRTAIRATLVAVCRVVAEERGLGLPADDVLSMAGYIHRHADWLAAHDAAAEHAKDLRDIAGDPTAFRVAYPARADRTYIGLCPMPSTALSGGDPGACGARLYRKAGEPDITCALCGATGTIDQWRWAIVGADAPGLVVDAYEAAVYLAGVHRRPEVDPGLVRKWGQRYGALLVRRGLDGAVLYDRRGRALYWLDELVARAGTMWGAPAGELAEAKGASA